jgi:hypothetical protein
MDIFKCDRCGRKFFYKSKLIRHLNNIIPCLDILSDKNIDMYKEELDEDTITIMLDGKKYYKCKFCKRVYKSASSKSLHQKKCELDKVKTNEDSIINNGTIYNNNINNINNGIINNNNNNINNEVLIANGNELNEINTLISYHGLANRFFSFPTYTMGHLLEKDHKLFKKSIKKCKKEDLDPSTSHRSEYSLILDLFKEILSVDDIRTKNTFIKEINDNIAYCLLDGKFYSIHTEDLFKIFFQHLPHLVNQIKKIKDSFNGMERDDKDYVEFSCERFKNFINSEDKTIFKREILNCIYNNKLFLKEVLNSAKPLDKIKNEKRKTINYSSNLLNRFRKYYDLPVIDTDINTTFMLKDKDIKFRNNTTNSNLSFTIEDYNNDPIIIDYYETKTISDGYVLYKAKYNGFDLWYNDIHEVGLISIVDETELIPKKDLCNLIDSFINSTQVFKKKDTNEIVNTD